MLDYYIYEAINLAYNLNSRTPADKKCKVEYRHVPRRKQNGTPPNSDWTDYCDDCTESLENDITIGVFVAQFVWALLSIIGALIIGGILFGIVGAIIFPVFLFLVYTVFVYIEATVPDQIRKGS